MNVISLVKEVDTNKVIACMQDEEIAYDLRRRLSKQRAEKQYMVEQRCIIMRKYTITYTLCDNIATPISLYEGPVMDGRLGSNTIIEKDNKLIVMVVASDIKSAKALANLKLKKLEYSVREI